MSEIKQAILKSTPTNSWQTGNQIKKRVEEILQDSIHAIDFYNAMKYFVDEGIIEYHQEKARAKGKFKKHPPGQKVEKPENTISIII